MNYCCSKTVDNKYTNFIDIKQFGEDVQLHFGYWKDWKPEVLLQKKES
jgi:hypothetical protein